MGYRLVAAEARANYRLWVRFEDGVEGEADLSDVAGRGIFERWTENPDEFAQVAIDEVTGAPIWPGDLDVAPDRLYAEVAEPANTSTGGQVKKTAKTAGIILLLIVGGALVSFRLLGYEPRDQRPGLWLTGDRVTEPVTDWSFTEQHQEIFVQTRTRYLIPHSITTYCTVHEGDLYLFSAYYQGGVFPDERGWNRNVMRDPRVRLKIGDRIFDQTVSHVTDAEIRAAVHENAVAKYPQWSSPGLENVHMLLVGS